MKQYDVVIIGGGPVGLGLAIELGQRNIHVAVVERNKQIQLIPKGQNLTQRTNEHFYFWRVREQIRKARTVPRELDRGGLTCYKTLLGTYHHDWLMRETVRSYYFADNERLPQYATEEVLRRRVSELKNVDVFLGWTAQAIKAHSDKTSAEIIDLATGEKHYLTGQFLVGADGSNSLVRSQSTVKQTQSKHNKLMVLLVFKSKHLNTLLKRYPGKSYYNVLHPELKGYWLFFGRVDQDNTWFFHAPVPKGTTENNFDFEEYLHRAVGQSFDLEFQHIGFWDLRVSIAQKYRDKRIFLAGDAAHSHPPYGGYGINTGFEDARNLGWKLTAFIQGWAGNNLLESYDEERRPVFESTARDFIENYIETDAAFLRKFSPEKDLRAFKTNWSARQSVSESDVSSFEPHYEGSSVVCGQKDAKCSAKGQHELAARIGHHLTPQPLSSGLNVYEELGEGLSLIVLDANMESVQAFIEAADELKIPLKVIHDTFNDGRESYACRLILIRPDQFVAWVGDQLVNSATSILKRVCGH